MGVYAFVLAGSNYFAPVSHITDGCKAVDPEL